MCEGIRVYECGEEYTSVAKSIRVWRRVYGCGEEYKSIRVWRRVYGCGEEYTGVAKSIRV